MSQKTHVMHGRDHLPEGADPIPGLLAGSGGGSTYPNIVSGLSNLRGYWRLGEPSSPFADTAGYSGGPYDMTLSGSLGSAPTLDVIGALPADDDDGAIELNNAGVQSSTSVRKLTGATGSSTIFTSATSISIAAWVKPTASATVWRGGIFENTTFASGSPSYEKGWGLECQWTGSAVNARMVRADSPGSGDVVAASAAITTGEWHHLVGTYDGTTIRLYVDGGLAASTGDSRSIGGNPWSNATIGIKTYGTGGGGSSAQYGQFYGVIDEVAFWAAVLTSAEVLSLYEAGVYGAAAAEGKVLTADGAGGTSWEWPTIEVTY